MSTSGEHDHKATIRRGLEEIWNRNDYAASSRYYAPDLVVHAQHQAEPLRGREAFGELHRILHTAFPDMNITVEDMIRDGDEVGVRWTVRGTHRGEYFGIPATGRQVRVEELVILRFEGRLVKELRLMPNLLGVMQQLGLPAGPPPRAMLAIMGLVERLGGLLGRGSTR